MPARRRLLLASLLVLSTAIPAAAEDPAPAPPESAPHVAGPCIDQLLARMSVSNPAEVCRLLLKGRDAPGVSLESLFEIREVDLGDGTPAIVFTQRSVGDSFAYRSDLHFVKRGSELVVVFDGEGVASRYATDRPRVNGRWQIERVTLADIPGLYRKREAETWFWNGREYVKAFSRVTIDQAKNPELNGTQIVWNPETEDFYKSAGPSWSHTVRSGDTLGAIARRHGATVAEIMRQNGIKSPNALRIGKTLRYEAWKANAR